MIRFFAQLPVAYRLMALAAVWLAAAVYCGYMVTQSISVEAITTAEGNRESLTKQPYYGCYLFAALLSAIAAIVNLSAGLYLKTRPETVSPAARKSVIVAILIAGVVSGAMLLGIGTRFFAEEFSVLNTWITSGQKTGAWKVVVALLAIVLGAGLMLAAVIPARAEERNDQTLRRLVFGTNAFVSALLVLIGLLLVNVVAAARLPNKLDTTETGFFTLDPAMATYLRERDQPVKVHAILGESRIANDARWMLTACQDANPAKIDVTILTPSELTKINALRQQYNAVEMDGEGLLVVVGDKAENYSFIPARELARFVQGQSADKDKHYFAGEARLYRELLYLGDGKVKPVIYFTQGSDEMTLEAKGEEPRPERCLSIVKKKLEEANLVVKPLEFDPATPVLPADAAAIVVADPRKVLSPELAKALKTWMLETKKGKLILLTGPSTLPRATEVTPTGLEEMLMEMNVILVPKYVLSAPVPQLRIPPEVASVTLTQSAVQSRHPIGLFVQRNRGEDFLPFCKSMEVARPGNPEYFAIPLLITDDSRVTWLEATMPENPYKRLAEMRESTPAGKKLRTDLDFYPRLRNVVVAVAQASPGDKPVGRLVVFGSSVAFSDAMAEAQKDGFTSHRYLSLSIDWLRDRPTVSVESKDYKSFIIKGKMDYTRLLLLPLGLTLLVIAGFGGAVWIVRRK